MNMKAILERHGSSLDRVVKCLVMIADMNEWPAMNAVYAVCLALTMVAFVTSVMRGGAKVGAPPA